MGAFYPYNEIVLLLHVYPNKDFDARTKLLKAGAY